jgi:hypothetical protein
MVHDVERCLHLSSVVFQHCLLTLLEKSSVLPPVHDCPWRVSIWRGYLRSCKSYTIRTESKLKLFNNLRGYTSTSETLALMYDLWKSVNTLMRGEDV